MNSFDIIKTNHKHNFVKSNPEMLSSMFGTTDVIPLWIADMDFEVATPIKEALQELIDRNIYAYEFNTAGIYKAIIDWNLKRHQLMLNSESFVQVTSVLTGIAVLIKELTNEGEGVMIQTPVYHQFANVIKSTGRKVVANPLKIVEGKYRMDLATIENNFKEGEVKLFLLCNPHNPVGRVWSKEELEELVRLANTYNVTIVSDEIHSDIVYAKATFHSIASLNESENHIVILGSPAKTFGMQSISNGYLYIKNEAMHENIKKVVSSMYLDHGSIIAGNATIAAYTKGEKWLDELLSYLENTLSWIETFLGKELPQVKLFTPEGTYQIWLDFSELELSDKALEHVIVKQAKLALAPGSWFESSHTQFMRMNIASPLETIQKVFGQLKEAIDDGVDENFNENEEASSTCSC